MPRMNSEAICSQCGTRVMTGEGNCRYVNERYQHDVCPKDYRPCKCGGTWPISCCCPASPDWMVALLEYARLREEIGRLEERGECSCEDFHTCDLCKGTSALDQQARSHMNLWGDTWAMKLLAGAPEPQEPK